MSKFPYLPFCVDAYRNDTPHLTLEQHGAYVTLLMLAWRLPSCRLPDDDMKLARMLGVTAKKWAALKPVVMDFWTLKDGFWSQRRLEKERDFVSRRAKTSADNGKQGGRPKSLSDNNLANPAGSSQDTQQEPGSKAPNTSHLTQGLEGKAVEPTELFPETPETDNTSDASRSAGKDRSGKSYAFEAGIIRLNAGDLHAWKARYPLLFLESELAALAAWAGQPENRGNWFFAVQGALAKRNRDQALAKEVAIAEAQARANAPAKPVFWTP